MARKIRINDFSNYDERFCNNGGAYGFWVDYVEQPGGQFAVYYGTTADLDYCPYCGSFGGGCGCDGPELISAETVEDIVRRFVPDEDHWMETEDLRPGEGEAYDVPRHDPEPLTELQRQRAEELYRHIGICPDAIVEDMAHDFLEVREGSDGEAYLVYVDYAQVAAIRISDGAILDETDRQDADRSPNGRDWFGRLFG